MNNAGDPYLVRRVQRAAGVVESIRTTARFYVKAVREKQCRGERAGGNRLSGVHKEEMEIRVVKSQLGVAQKT